MFVRRLASFWLLALLGVPAIGQTIPHLSQVPNATDTKLNGTAQGLTDPYDQVQLYVCFSAKKPAAPSDCSAAGAASAQVALVNLGNGPYRIDTPDGKFTITLKNSLPSGTYVWIVQKARTKPDQKAGSQSDQSVATNFGDLLRVRVPLISKASFLLSGTGSASRDAGGKVNLDFNHGFQGEGIGETLLLTSTTYDDKWKSTPSSSNVTQNYLGQLFQWRQFSPYAAWGLAASAYHNNTQGIRVEQTYGAGISVDANLGNGNSAQLSAVVEALLENLYNPGVDTNLGGVHLSGEIEHQFGEKTSVDLTLAGTPVFTQSRAWSASGSFDLNIKISQHWSFDFNPVDNYYEIAPKTFNKNYFAPSIGLTFK